MRLGAFVFAACALLLPACLAAQTYSRTTSVPSSSVIRPAPTDGWRNYVTVPDGPCGCPMSVEADCYNDCPHCRPLQFLHRVTRMFDCLLPCNMCCRGGCGLFHGCHLGGRTWGHCGVCCGAACDGCGGCGSCGNQSGCCPNPCGSAFDSYAPSRGGHCTGCSSVVPGLSDPFQDDPLPPKPTATPVPEVRRGPAYRTQPAHLQTPSARAATPMQGPYKIVSTPANLRSERPTNRQPAATQVPIASPARSARSESVLRRASAEQETIEGAPRIIEHPHAAPIIRSQSPDAADETPIPRNPLRN